MRERSELVLRALCAAFVLVLLYQAGRAVSRFAPLAQATIPQLPTLSPPLTNAASRPSGGATGAPPPRAEQKTNAPASKAAQDSTTNTGAQVSVPGTTNPPPGLDRSRAASGPGISPGMPPGGPRPRPGTSGMGSAPELPPAVQARLQRITESGILGMMMRPPPMALLGIAGNHVLFRAPNGQTGLLQAGGEMGGVKLLSIGTNRVLVEENGEKKELSIFEGFGGASLLPK